MVFGPTEIWINDLGKLTIEKKKIDAQDRLIQRVVEGDCEK
jgi:hypothetical protein